MEKLIEMFKEKGVLVGLLGKEGDLGRRGLGGACDVNLYAKACHARYRWRHI
jgi:hypothetical protein